MLKKIIILVFVLAFVLGCADKQPNQENENAINPALENIHLDVNTNPYQGVIYFSTGKTLNEKGVEDKKQSIKKPTHIHPNGSITFYKDINNSNLFQKLANGYTVVSVFPEDYVRGGTSTFQLFDENGLFVANLSSPKYKQTDFHDIISLRNGNFLIFSYVNQVLEETNQTIKKTVLQEVDVKSNLIKEWDSLEHVPLTESTIEHDKEKRGVWDYFHVNSLFEDAQGNILVSARNTDTIYKIDWKTGEILWRLGGKYNDFSFINDPYNGFLHQHDATITNKGTVLLYDNGEINKRNQTRVVEYSLNEEKMTATLVWSYEKPNKFTGVRGSVQRLPNENTFIGWGVDQTTTRMTEVSPQGEVVLEIDFPDGEQIYRAYKYS